MRRMLGPACACVLVGIQGCTAAPRTPGMSPLAGKLFINEFMASNASVAADENGEYDDWIELYNASDKAVSLSGLYLTDDLAATTRWPLPNQTIPASGHLLVWADGECDQGALHASFKLKADPGEQIGLYATEWDEALIVDTLSFGRQGRDTAYGRIPDGGRWQYLTIPTPDAENTTALSEYSGTLFINEFMAANSRTLADEAGDYDDWIELYNSGDAAVSLKGLYLTDDLAAPEKWSFPDTAIPGGGYLLVWADDETTEGPLHAAFNLAAALGEQLGLYSPYGRYVLLIDTLSFGPQRRDTSYGRLPDGGEDWQFLSTPTPRAPNQ